MIGQTISHYTIIEKLGEGGMGVVYKAQDTKLDRFVAIKFLPTHLSSASENKARFLQEAKATAALNHPNILSIFEIDEHDGSTFIVLEYIDGQNLKDYLATLKTGSGVPVKQAIEWTEKIAQGLKVAHDKDIIHRDIKAENIMLTKSGQLKIMDFGLAKLRSQSSLTRAGSSLGTLSYMSPEQAQGMNADNRSDLWSLGILFFELLTGDLPFKSEHEAGLMYLVVNQDPPLPSELDRRLPASIDTIVMKMLQKEREKRFQNAAELLDALSSLSTSIESKQTQANKMAIAVLPFTTIGGDKENEYFGDGLTDELIVSLSQLKDFDVISRTNSMQYKSTSKDIKTIGKELGIRYLLEGSVRKFQDNLRITVQFIDVDNGRQLWAESFKGKMEDVFDIQEQVSKQVVEALKLKLSPNEKIILTKRSTVNAEAFDCYLRAREFLYRRTKSSLQFAIQLFQKAIELDTRYAAAYAGLGECYATLHYDYDTKEVWVDKAIESSLKALMYDSSVAEAYAALAMAYFSKKTIQEAEIAARKAIELGPNIFTGYWVLARICHVMQRDAEAVELFKKTIELNPDFHTAYGQLRMAYERLGEKENMDAIIKVMVEMFPVYLSKHPDDARSHIHYAIQLATVGKDSEALAQTQKAIELSPDDPLMLYNAACVYSRLGQNTLAVETLRKSIIAGREDYEWIKTDIDLDGIRNEPGYIELMKGK
ncbi:MAG: protein kinase [Ignavibacteriales bacterium]|nr:protein kinase [Ignavibacteriales bacterium]